MNEAPPPPDYAYSEYMLWMKPFPPLPDIHNDMDEALPPHHPSDYAYYEYMVWIKPHPLTTPIQNI